MNEISRIADELDRAYGGDPWHGLPLTRILDDLSARQAVACPVPGVHSIWEIVLHVSGWIGEVHQRLRGGEPGEPTGGDWPPVRDASDAAWARTRAELEAAHRALRRELDATPEERLWAVVGTQSRDRAQGTGVSFYVMLHGLAQHNAYHGAQIAMLRRLIDAP